MRISDWSSDVCSSDLESLTSAQAQSIEPELRCTAALFSPSTGIIDSHAYMLALQGEAEAHGVLTALGVRLDRKSVVQGKGVSVRVDLGGRRIIKTKKNTDHDSTSKNHSKQRTL